MVSCFHAPQMTVCLLASDVRLSGVDLMSSESPSKPEAHRTTAPWQLTQIRDPFLWGDGAIFDHHLHKVNQGLHDSDQSLTLLSILL